MADNVRSPSEGSSRQEISPAMRNRLQQCFAKANSLMAQGSYDYATELFTQCVVGDPANQLYLQSFLANLKKKYNNNKKGAKGFSLKLPSFGGRKSASQKDWQSIVKGAVDVLKGNPWDVATLRQLAEISEEMGWGDQALVCLATAREAAPNDIDVVRAIANALNARKRYDQSLLMWHQVLKLKPDDTEASQQISTITVERTIDHGHYEDREKAKEKLAASTGGNRADDDLPADQRLEKKIARHPEDLTNYLELADLHLRTERYEKAIEVLARAVDVSKNDAVICERLEDAELRSIRARMLAAEKEAASGTEEAKARHNELKKEFVLKELQIYQGRCERFPNNLSFRFELGVRLQACGKYKEAIGEFQRAQAEPRRRGACLLRLGQCFQHIQQYRMAMGYYEEALKEISERDLDERKHALYRAGRLALGLKDLDKAEEHLSTLARLDFTYKDISTLLDKIARLREDSGAGDTGPGEA